MKVTVCLALLCAFVALSAAEDCRRVEDCGHVTCPENDYMIECHNRQCTCTHTAAVCASPSDCSNTGDSCRLGWHCIDTKCRCGYFGGIGK